MGPGHMAMGFQLPQVGHAGFDFRAYDSSRLIYSQISGCFLTDGTVLTTLY